jgi:hypothetical protein
MTARATNVDLHLLSRHAGNAGACACTTKASTPQTTTGKAAAERETAQLLGYTEASKLQPCLFFTLLAILDACCCLVAPSKEA